jgi:sn-glycerol 3-phosphate transport system substrate-binding protein
MFSPGGKAMRKLHRVAIAAFAALALAAPAALAQTAPAPVAKTADAAKLQVWFAVSGANGEAFKGLLDRFNAVTADIDVSYSFSGSYGDTATKVSAALVSKTAPDVALMAAGPLYTGGQGDFYMEGKINEADFKKGDVFPGVWEYAKIKGRICAVPYGISVPILYYNKTILAKAGIDLAKNPPRSWDDLARLARQAQANGNVTGSTDFWGFDTTDAAWLFKTMLNQNGNTVINVKGDAITAAFADDSAVQVATWWKKLVDDKVMPVGQHSNAEKKFLSGNVAFLVATSARIAAWSKDPANPAGATAMPFWKKASVALGGNVLVVLSQNPKLREASWRLVKWLASAEIQTEFALKTGYLPIRKSGVALPAAAAAVVKNPMYAIAFDQLDISWSYFHFDQMGTMDQILVQAIDVIERGAASPKDALSKAAKDLDAEM